MSQITDLPPPDSPNGRQVVTPASRQAWREWLDAHPERKDGVWVVYRKKSSGLRGPDYDDLVEEALCFGWIDSQYRRVDDERAMQWFSPRRKGGVWSATNKARIESLVDRGLMAAAGRAAIEAARADGSFFQTDEVDALIMPADLEAALAANPAAGAAYAALPDSAKAQRLWWVVSARTARTREERIARTVEELAPSGAPRDS